MGECAQGHFLLPVGSVTLPLLQLVTNRVFIKLHAEKQGYRGDGLHSAGPEHASETGTQYKDIWVTGLNTYIPCIKICDTW